MGYDCRRIPGTLIIDDSSGQTAVVYDQVARAAGDMGGMVGGSQGNASIQSGRESANLVPNLNYTANEESFE